MSKTLAQIVPAEFLKRLREAADLVDSFGNVRAVSHYDADGTSSAAVITKALMRRGSDFHTTLYHNLDEELVRRLNDEHNELVIVSDMGSGQIDLLEKLEAKAIVLDHHAPLKSSDKVLQVNPHLFGFSGTKEACGSTTSLMFALALDEGNWDLASIALVGCIADRQSVGGFKGLNKGLFEEAAERHIIKGEKRIALKNLSAVDSLTYSIGPYFRGLSGRRDEVEKFLEKLNIPLDTSIRELSSSQGEALISALAVKLLRQGTRPETAEGVVEEKFWMDKEGMYADEFESLINACSRLGHESLGLSLCLGDPQALEKAQDMRKDYVTEMLKWLHKLENEGAYERAHLQFFYSESATLAGSLAGLAMQYLFNQEKPTLALAVVEGKTKVSSRATDYLVAKGIDLAVALREAAQGLGGTGGGHNIAAGATIPRGKEEAFLQRVDEIAAAQLVSKVSK